MFSPILVDFIFIFKILISIVWQAIFKIFDQDKFYQKLKVEIFCESALLKFQQLFILKSKKYGSTCYKYNITYKNFWKLFRSIHLIHLTMLGSTY